MELAVGCGDHRCWQRHRCYAEPELARRGAKLVLNDVDEAALAGVAEQTGAVAVAGDVAQDGDVRALVDTALKSTEESTSCANAGVARHGTGSRRGAGSSRGDQRHGARPGGPGVLPLDQRGRGHFRHRVRRGLLTSLGAAPYSVTKHAALAFAEWLAITYADRGISVQALCPQGVRTRMLDNTGETGKKLLEPGALDPDTVAEVTAESLGNGKFLILPHPEVAEYYARRAADPDRWQDGMRRLQHKITSS